MNYRKTEAMKSILSILIFFISLNILSSCSNNKSKNEKKKFSPQKNTPIKIDSIKNKTDRKSFFNDRDSSAKNPQTDHSLHLIDKTTKDTFNNNNNKNSVNKIKNKKSTKTSVSDEKSERQPFVEQSFPIIIYSVPNTDGAFAVVKKWGATHIQRYGMGSSIKKDQSFFDRAAAHNLRVMSDLRMRDRINKKNGIEAMRAYVRHFKNHPALGFWYLSDEPDNKGYAPGELVPFYKMIKKETPNISIAMAHAWSKRWYKYGQAEDILMYDNYPIYGETFPKIKLNTWTNFTKNAFKRGGKDKDMVIPILQMFNWKAIAGKKQKMVKGFATDKLRFPNIREIRYMSFSSIALGARGLAFYSYGRSRKISREWAGRVLEPVIQEAKAFKSQVKNNQMKQILGVESSEMFLTVWKGKESTFMILANATPDNRQVQQTLEGTLKAGTLKPWGETRKTKASLKNGSIVINNIKPWEVCIWRVL